MTCMLIGQDNLLLECAALLKEAHFDIRCVISSTRAIQSWCEENQIPCFSSFDALPSLHENQVDYLFSIVNGVLLSEKQIKLARLGAINYHDSLLPQYAGVHATTWALMHHETVHGITWHMINAGIDEGEVVYQQAFPISDEDTALSLNLRCFEEALKGFSSIIRAICSNTLVTTPQNKTQRSYYGKNHPLPNLGFIHWEKLDAKTIHAMDRALTFGDYSNNVGTLKLFLGETYLNISRIEIVEDKITEASPGTVLSIKNDEILVSTRTQAIRIKKITDQYGVALSEALLARYHIVKNYQFPGISGLLNAEEITLYQRALAREKQWLQRLANTVDHATFSGRLYDPAATATALAPISINASEKIQNNELLYLFASVLIYLYRINDYEHSTFYFDTTACIEASRIKPLFRQYVPLTPSLRSDSTFMDVLGMAEQLLTEINSTGIVLNDLFLRHPQLSLSQDTPGITISFSSQAMPKHSLLHFYMDKQTHSLHLLHRLNRQYLAKTFDSVIANMSSHINNIVEKMIANPATAINQFSFLTAAEENALLDWGTGEAIPLPSNSVWDLFVLQAKRAPSAIALRDNHSVLTYDDMLKVCEKVSDFIKRLALPEQTEIGIFMPATQEMYILILGILKANCIAVPLHPSDAFPKASPFNSIFSNTVYGKKLAAQIHSNQVIYTIEEMLEAADSKNHIMPYTRQHESQNALAILSQNEAAQTSFITGKKIIQYCYKFIQDAKINKETVLDVSSMPSFDLTFSCTLAPFFVGGALAF